MEVGPISKYGQGRSFWARMDQAGDMRHLGTTGRRVFRFTFVTLRRRPTGCWSHGNAFTKHMALLVPRVRSTNGKVFDRIDSLAEDGGTRTADRYPDH